MLQVQTRNRCDTCKGEGELPNPSWNGITKEQFNDPEQRKKWWNENKPKGVFIYGADGQVNHPRTLDCQSCGGAGYSASYMNLPDLIKIAKDAGLI